MRRILIVAAVPSRSGWCQTALLTDPRCRRIATTPQVSAVWKAKGVEHRVVEEYFRPPAWDPVHALAMRQLRGLVTAREVASLPAWIEDWSHLIVDELRVDVFWAEVAKRILRRERPREIWVQRVATAHPVATSLAALVAEFASRGFPPKPWTPARTI